MTRQLTLLALASLLPFILLSAWARLVPVAGWELELLAALTLSDGAWAALVRSFNTLGDLWVWAALTGALSVIALLLRRWAAAALIGLTLLADLAGFAVKLLVERARPEGMIVDHVLGGETFAFPSGHVIRVTALVAVLIWLLAPAHLRLPLAVVAGIAAGCTMAYCRVALGVHWPTDVIGGLLFGLFWFALTAHVLMGKSSERALR